MHGAFLIGMVVCGVGEFSNELGFGGHGLFNLPRLLPLSEPACPHTTDSSPRCNEPCEVEGGKHCLLGTKFESRI